MTILNIAAARSCLAEIGIPEDCLCKLTEVLRQIAASDELKRLFTSYYRDEVLSGRWKQKWSIVRPHHPLIYQTFGAEFSLFYLLCCLERLYDAKEEYAARGYPHSLYVRTMGDIAYWIRYWRDTYGTYCFPNIGWIWQHLSCELFQLGAFQFRLITYEGDIVAFVDARNQRTMVFRSSPCDINKNGDVVGAGGGDSEPAFRTSYDEDNEVVRANLVTPYGKVTPETVTLKKAEWQCVFRTGSDILDFHIPRIDALTTEVCVETLNLAERFYATHFKERPPVGLLGMPSWLFAPQLQDMLGRETNIVKFQREFFLLPHAGSYRSIWNFVFSPATTLATAPRDTSLRRKVIEYIENKRPLFDLGGLYLQPFHEWGAQRYMTDYDNEVQ